MVKIKKLVVAGVLGLGLMSPFVATEAHALNLPTIEGGYIQTYDDSFQIYGMDGDTITGHYEASFRDQNTHGPKLGGDFRINTKEMTIFFNITSYFGKPYYEDWTQIWSNRYGIESQVLAKYLVGMTNYQRPDLLPNWKAKILFEGK